MPPPRALVQRGVHEQTIACQGTLLCEESVGKFAHDDGIVFVISIVVYNKIAKLFLVAIDSLAWIARAEAARGSVKEKSPRPSENVTWAWVAALATVGSEVLSLHERKKRAVRLRQSQKLLAVAEVGHHGA